MRIVVGVDESPASAAALAWAAGYARTAGHRLEAVHAFVWAEEERLLLPTGLTTVTAAHRAHTDPVPPAAVRVAFDALPPEPDWTLVCVAGDPVPVLVEQSRSAGLLVIGTGEHGVLGRMLVGSVSHRLLSRAHCPVVAVPVGWHQRDAEAAELSRASAPAETADR